MVLGFLPEARYTSATVKDLAAGDRIVFYTDGLTEASRADGEFFGDRQFRDALTIGLSEPADRFLATLVDRARQWSGADFADDVTVVVVDWTRRATPVDVARPLEHDDDLHRFTGTVKGL
jgi:sigma-B regulation protein RsbU (phosphoserine phosphatase)